MRSDQTTVSTFLPDQSHIFCTPSLNPPEMIQSSNSTTVNMIDGSAKRIPLTEVYQDPRGYSRLCRSTQMTVFSRHSPTPSRFTQETQSPYCPQATHLRTQTAEMSSRKTTAKSDNLIELLDSSRASSCSQSCDCAVFTAESQSPGVQPLTSLLSYNEQSEFVWLYGCTSNISFVGQPAMYGGLPGSTECATRIRLFQILICTARHVFDFHLP